MLVDALSKTPGTLLHRELIGDDFSLEQRLLAAVVDRLAVANWQRQGKASARRPTLISPTLKRRAKAKRDGSAPRGGRSQAEVDDLLAKMRNGTLGGG